MWKKIDIDAVRKFLSEDEIEKLTTYSKSEDIDDILQQQIDTSVSMFRAAWQQKGYTIFPVEGYIDEGYEIWILSFIRYAIWTRFPNSEQIALDGPRKNMYEKALELMKDPYLSVSKINPDDYPDVPDLPELLDSEDDKAIKMPGLRIKASYWGPGYREVDKMYYNFPWWNKR